MSPEKAKKYWSGYFVSGVTFSFLFWLVESLAHALLFEDGMTLHAFFPHDYNELWMRGIAVIIIMSFSVYAFIARKQREILEIKLEDSEERFEELVDTLPQTVFETDVTGGLTFVNKAAFEIFGFNMEDIKRGLNVLDVIAPESKDKARENIEKVLSGENLKGSEYKASRKDGMLFPIHVYSSAIVRDDQVDGIRGVVFDITAIKKERESLEKMSLAVMNSPASVVITDSEGNIDYVNPEFSRITGYHFEEVAGKSSDFMKSGLSEPEVCESLKKTLEAGGEWRGTLANRRKSGDIYWEDVRSAPVMDNEGKLLCCVEVREDITDRKILLDKLISSERRLSSILNNIQDTYFRSDMEGMLIMLSPSVDSLLGYAPSELVGKHRNETFLALLVSDGSLSDLEKRGGTIKDMEIELCRKEGHVVPVSANMQYYYNDEGAVAGIEGTLRDISLRKKSEKRLERYATELEKSNYQKELYIDIMSHDILNPINTILNAADILAQAETEDGRINFIRMIQESSLEIEERIKLARIYSRLTNTHEIDTVELDLNHILEHSIDNFMNEFNEKSTNVKYNPLPGSMIKGNKFIYDVISNLLSNAIKYGPHEGVVETGVEDGGKYWIAYVKDQGEGIPDEDKERVFNRFERLKKGVVRGSGLGLAIVKRIVDLHGGKIRVEDNPDGGAVFKVMFLKSGQSQAIEKHYMEAS